MISRVLVTNDDGIDAPGIAVLAQALATRFDVIVAAPDRDWSGAGTGIGLIEATGVKMRRVEVASGPGYAVDGPPGLAVMAAALGAFGSAFDAVISGVNAGTNTGQSVIHSGTVGAALTARTFGWHGVAISTAPGDPWHWDTAAEIAVAVTAWIAAGGGDPTAVNVNVPAAPAADVLGLRRASLDRFGHFRVAVANDAEQRLAFEVSSDCDDLPAPDSDTELLRQGYATITTLGPLVGSSAGLPDDLHEIWRPITSAKDAGQPASSPKAVAVVQH